MKEKFEDVLRRELKNEFEKQMNVQINQNELGKVMREYKKIKKFQKTPWYDVMQMEKKDKENE